MKHLFKVEFVGHQVAHIGVDSPSREFLVSVLGEVLKLAFYDDVNVLCSASNIYSATTAVSQRRLVWTWSEERKRGNMDVWFPGEGSACLAGEIVKIVERLQNEQNLVPVDVTLSPWPEWNGDVIVPAPGDTCLCGHVVFRQKKNKEAKSLWDWCCFNMDEHGARSLSSPYYEAWVESWWKENGTGEQYKAAFMEYAGCHTENEKDEKVEYGWKVVTVTCAERPGADGKYPTEYLSIYQHNGAERKYVVGEWTVPAPGAGPLTVFDTKEHCRDWMREFCRNSFGINKKLRCEFVRSAKHAVYSADGKVELENEYWPGLILADKIKIIGD